MGRKDPVRVDYLMLRRSGFLSGNIDQPSCDVARAFFEVIYGTPPIGSTSHVSGFHAGNANLDISGQPSTYVTVLKALANDDDGLSGFDDGKTFPDPTNRNCARSPVPREW
jgi:hypothetical protein